MKNKLTRAQCLEILRAPRGASMTAFAKRFEVTVELVRHVRYKCAFMLRGQQ